MRASMIARASRLEPGRAAVLLIFALFWVMIGCLEFYGGLKMFQGRSWGLALAGSIVLMIPVVGAPIFDPCCLLITMPIGIWATVVLCIEKDSFR